MLAALGLGAGGVFKSMYHCGGEGSMFCRCEMGKTARSCVAGDAKGSAADVELKNLRLMILKNNVKPCVWRGVRSRPANRIKFLQKERHASEFSQTTDLSSPIPCTTRVNMTRDLTRRLSEHT